MLPHERMGIEDVEFRPAERAITFHVTGLDAVLQRLGGDDVEIIGPEADSDGRHATLRDPDGNIVRLYEPALHAAASSDSAAISPISEDGESADEQPNTHRPPLRRWLTWAPVVLVVVLGVAALVVLQPGTTPEASDSTSDATPSPSSESTTTTSAAQQNVVRVIETGGPVLGVEGGWELFMRGPDALVRLEMSSGRITITDLPIELSGHPSLFVGPEKVLLRSRGSESDYLVPGGKPPRAAPELAPRTGIAIPGPKPGTLWVRATPLNAPSGTREGYVAVTLEGEPIGQHRDGWDPRPHGDRKGNVLLTGTGGVYLATQHQLTKVTTGEILAVGPTRFIVRECGQRSHCSKLVVNRVTGTRHPLPGGTGTSRLPKPSGVMGVVAPDASVAARIVYSTPSAPQLRVVELDSGQTHTLGPVNPDSGSSALVFSPNGRWLFFVYNGELRVYDTHTWHQVDPALGVNLPRITELALRTA